MERNVGAFELITYYSERNEERRIAVERFYSIFRSQKRAGHG